MSHRLPASPDRAAGQRPPAGARLAEPLASPNTWLVDVAAIAGRGVRALRKEPESIAAALLMPLCLFAIQVGALADVASEAFGIPDYAAFQLPVVLLFAATWTATGQALVSDISSGYWDKLCVTPVRRSALVVGRVLSEMVGVTGYVVVLLVFGWAIGVRFQGNQLAGAALLLLLVLLFSIGFDAIHITVAFMTRSVRATQSVALMTFFPLLFLTPWIVPRPVMVGWMAVVVSGNPVTYVLEAARALLFDPDPATLARGLFAGALFAGAGLVAAGAAFRRHSRRA